MITRVEGNEALIRVGDILHYSDAANWQQWKVTETFDDGFKAKTDYETKIFNFNELQHGWEISSKTKREHEDNDNYIYQ